MYRGILGCVDPESVVWGFACLLPTEFIPTLKARINLVNNFIKIEVCNTCVTTLSACKRAVCFAHGGVGLWLSVTIRMVVCVAHQQIGYTIHKIECCLHLFLCEQRLEARRERNESGVDCKSTGTRLQDFFV